MKPFERREHAAYPYYKLATWDDRNFAWRDGKSVQETESAAIAEASKPGRYRISRIEESGRIDLTPFVR